MESRRRPGDAGRDDDEQPAVTAHESRPGRTVFTEKDNSDAWIATDLTVDPEP